MARFEKIVEIRNGERLMLSVNTDYITGRKLETIELVIKEAPFSQSIPEKTFSKGSSF